MDFDFKMKLTGIGPHFNTELSSRVSSINMALYADNGSGKSFISKSFKRVTDLKYLDTTDPDKVSALIEKSSAMVRFGEKQGTLSLSIKPDSEPQKELSVKFSADSLPEIADNTGLIYHVFNSEYVRENLEAVKYRPEDRVSGFILGKSNIDLSKEKERLEEYEKKEKQAIGDVNGLITAALKELRTVGIQTNTKEYLGITYENAIKGEETSEKQSYNQLIDKYDLLKSMPETLQDVSYRPFMDDIDAFIGELDKANDIIEHEYSLSSFSEAFKKRFKENQTFIESGLQLSDGEKCPFCGQRYNDNALSLIDDYNAFLKDEESKIIKAINNINARISSFLENLSTNNRAANKTATDFDKVKKYFPSFSDVDLSCVDISSLEQILGKICSALETKKQKVSQKGESIKSFIGQVRDGLNAYKKAEIANIGKVKELNSNKNNISAERLRLRKALCNARFNQIISDSQKTREEIVKALNPWSVNSVAATAAGILFRDEDFIRKTKKLIADERRFCVEELNQIKGLKVFNPSANFVLVKITDENRHSDELFDFCIRKKLMIRDCATFPYLNEQFFRFCFMKHEENILLLQAIKEFMEG